MSTVMTSADLPQDASHAPHHRRSREEVEALAQNFVATPVEEVAPPKSRSMLMAAVAGAVVVAGLVAYLAWPSSGAQAPRAAAPGADRAAAEVEELRLRLEAERERQRKELAAGSDYLERIAAADAALVKDLSAQADRLADRQASLTASAPAPAPAPARPAPAGSSEQLPTPRDEAARRAAAPATSSPTPVTAAPSSPQKVAATTAPQQKAATAQAQPAQAAPAAAEPVTVAQAPAANCSIHVSELSSGGKLTYEGIRKMKGVRIDETTGHVFTPPVPAAGGRKVVFEVMPNGCVSVARR